MGKVDIVIAKKFDMKILLNLNVKKPYLSYVCVSEHDTSKTHTTGMKFLVYGNYTKLEGMFGWKPSAESPPVLCICEHHNCKAQEASQSNLVCDPHIKMEGLYQYLDQIPQLEGACICVTQ